MTTRTTITFISGNEGKIRETQTVLPGVISTKIELDEIQHIDSREVIKHKLLEAQKTVSGSIMVEETSLSLDCLKGLPGALIKWFLKSIGNDGIWNLAKLHNDFGAEALSVIGLIDGNGEIKYFEGAARGKITEPRGENGFGCDPIFQPDGYNKTYGEMNFEEKSALSMRTEALHKLRDYLSVNNSENNQLNESRQKDSTVTTNSEINTQEELVPIVNQNGVFLFTTTKQQAHERGLLHPTVVAFVRNKKKEMLLVTQSGHKQDAMLYAAPIGGHINAGETYEEALHRETLEELGIKPEEYTHQTLGTTIYRRKVIKKDENHLYIIFELELKNEIKLQTNDEIESTIWMSEEMIKRSLREDSYKFGLSLFHIIGVFYKHLLLEP